MTPFYKRDGITIYHGDCMSVMPHLDISFDAVITDPPFGIGFSYDLHDDDPAQYKEMMLAFINLAKEKAIKGAPFFVWQSMKKASIWHEWFLDEYRIFAACKSFTQYYPVSIQYSWDPVIFWGELKGQPTVYAKDYHEQRLAPFGAHREKNTHPCPRPVEQVAYIISIATLQGDTILDPFCGSGTTLVAAQQLGRRAVGIEISEDYCNIAVERLRQRSLWQITPVRPEQEEMKL